MQLTSLDTRRIALEDGPTVCYPLWSQQWWEFITGQKVDAPSDYRPK